MEEEKKKFPGQKTIASLQKKGELLQHQGGGRERCGKKDGLIAEPTSRVWAPQKGTGCHGCGEEGQKESERGKKRLVLEFRELR